MDQLKMPPAGNWRPAINLPSLLISIQILLGEANPNDPLDADIVRIQVDYVDMKLILGLSFLAGQRVHDQPQPL